MDNMVLRDADAGGEHGQSHQKHWFTNNARIKSEGKNGRHTENDYSDYSHSYFLLLFKTWSFLKAFIIDDWSKTN